MEGRAPVVLDRESEGRTDELLLGLREGPKLVLLKVVPWSRRRRDVGQAAHWGIE